MAKVALTENGIPFFPVTVTRTWTCMSASCDGGFRFPSADALNVSRRFHQALIDQRAVYGWPVLLHYGFSAILLFFVGQQIIFPASNSNPVLFFQAIKNGIHIWAVSDFVLYRFPNQRRGDATRILS